MHVLKLEALDVGSLSALGTYRSLRGHQAARASVLHPPYTCQTQFSTVSKTCELGTDMKVVVFPIPLVANPSISTCSFYCKRCFCINLTFIHFPLLLGMQLLKVQRHTGSIKIGSTRIPVFYFPG